MNHTVVEFSGKMSTLQNINIIRGENYCFEAILIRYSLEFLLQVL